MKVNRLLAIFLLTAGLTAAGCRGSAGTVVTDKTPSMSVGEPARITTEQANAAEPSVAIDKDGNAVVVWMEHDGKTGTLWLQRFDRNLRTVGEKIRITPPDVSAKAWHGDPPSIVASADGSIYVGWNRGFIDGSGNDLVLSVSRDGGATFAEPVVVNDDGKQVSHGMHALAVNGSGRVIMAWLDERNVHKEPHKMDMTGDAMKHEEAEPNSEVFYAVSEDGKRFSANKRLASDACPCCKVSLLAADNSSVYASWRQVLTGDMRHIAVASSTDGGDSFAPPVVVSDDKWQLSACPVSGAALASDKPGQLTVNWYTAGEAGQAGLYSATSTDGGKTFSPRAILSAEAKSGMPFILGPSGAVSLFQSRGDRLEFLSHNGNGAPSLFIENAVFPSAYLRGDAGYACFVRKANDKTSVWLTRISRS